MPIRDSEKARYPKDWKAISDRIRFERAKGQCEWPDCGAPHGEVILRLKSDPERWRSPNGADCGEADPDYKACKVILTVAHLNHTPEDCREENLMAMCQLHHLRYDAEHHRKNAAATRRLRLKTPNLFEMA